MSKFSSKNINKIKVPESPVVLAILDGWGHREENLDNAIKNANTHILRKIMTDKPASLS